MLTSLQIIFNTGLVTGSVVKRISLGTPSHKFPHCGLILKMLGALSWNFMELSDSVLFIGATPEQP